MANNVVIAIKTKLDSKGIKQLRTQMGKAKKEAKRIRAELGQAFGGAASVVGAAAFTAAISIGKESIELFREQARVEAQLNSVLKSTQSAAGLTAGEIKRLASELQGVTNFGDEATLAGQNLLLTFKNIGGEVFPAATETMLNMSTAMNQGIKESAIQLGKALNDPVAGVSALSRVGVQFTEVQKKQIESLQENNDLFGAQAIILKELESQFGGSARAAREVDGNITAAANAVGDLQEAIGKELVANMGPFNEQVIVAAEGWTSMLGSVGLLVDSFKDAQGSASESVANWNIVSLWQQTMEKQYTALGNFIAPTIIEATVGLDNFTDALEENVKAVEELDNADFSLDIPEAPAEVEVNQDLIDAQQKTARSLIKINEDAAAEIPGIWDEFFDGVGNAWETFREDLAKVEEDGAKEQLKIEEDLAKDLERVKTDLVKSLASIDKDLSKSLAKTSAKEQKDVLKKQTSFSKERVREEKRRQIDTLADQRLFDFELRNLAADGQGNRIRELLERREIEQAISQEKNALESQIDQEKHSEEITAIKETASERRNQLILDAAEDRAQKTQDAAEEKERLKVAAEEAQIALQEELDERRQAIQDNLTDELAALDESRVEKLAANEEGRKESISALARGLAETQDLTEEELSKVAEIAGRLGEDAGVAFADGLAKGAATNQMVENLITGTTPSSPAARPGTGFKNGGSFTVGGSGGPDSQLVAFNATPGERVSISPQGQGGGVTVNVNGVGAADLAAILQNKVSEGIQEYNDNHIVPALTGL